MKKIAVSGGKGGTGKSTFAILLANKLNKEGKKVVLCDCDVECPNDYLISGEKLKTPKKKIYFDFPGLDKKKCKKCGLCVKTCKENAIFQVPGKYPNFIYDLCSACGACSIACPHNAIKDKKEEVGKIFTNQLKNNFWLITGSARSGLEETGSVVSEVKKFALKFTKEKKADVIIFDTAAGTHCPVISAVIDCNFAYVVTEPTPMGGYDLDLILRLLKKMKIPARVVLNQADLGNKSFVQEVLKKKKLKIEKEILYSKKIAEAYSKGKMLNIKSESII